jgi:hypothetical protein
MIRIPLAAVLLVLAALGDGVAQLPDDLSGLSGGRLYQPANCHGSDGSGVDRSTAYPPSGRSA